MTARWQKTSEAVKTISAEKVRIKIYLSQSGVATAIKIFFGEKFLSFQQNCDPWLTYFCIFIVLSVLIRISRLSSLP